MTKPTTHIYPERFDGSRILAAAETGSLCHIGLATGELFIGTRVAKQDDWITLFDSNRGLPGHSDRMEIRLSQIAWVA